MYQPLCRTGSESEETKDVQSVCLSLGHIAEPDIVTQSRSLIEIYAIQTSYGKANQEVIRIEKLPGTSVGKRIELSLFVKDMDHSISSISLTIYTTTLDKNPAYNQEGICKDERLCHTIIEGIKSACKNMRKMTRTVKQPSSINAELEFSSIRWLLSMDRQFRHSVTGRICFVGNA